MFGIAVARLDQISEEEKARYQACYCGLCMAIRDRYGQASRAALSYDLTFFAMLCDSLHETEQTEGAEKCPSHPAKPQRFVRSPWSDYAADLTVALAYHKCLDDIADSESLRKAAAGRVGAAALENAYNKASAHAPCECSAIEKAMARTRMLEQGGDSTDPDAVAKCFGALMGELFAHDQGFWTESMRRFGNSLGYLVYLMDAAVDVRDDKKSGSYNPFICAGLDNDIGTMRTILQTAAAAAADAFERLPLERDVHLMRSVLYSGIWQKFNQTYEKELAES